MTSTLTERSQSFGHLFVERVAKTPNGEAYRYLADGQWQSLSWTQTKDRVFKIAAGLIDLGVQPQQRVAIAATTRIEWILSDLATLCAGGATTTVYPSTAAPDVAFILGDSESVVVFAENEAQAEKVRSADLPALLAIVLFDKAASPTESSGSSESGVPTLTLDELMARGETRLAAEPDVVDNRLAGTNPEDLATLIYTSGTTGRPKGVRLVHANWTYEGSAVAALNILTPQDVQYLWLPMSHVLGKVLSAVQFELGFSTAVDGDLTKIVENLAVIKPTFMGGAPRIFEKVHTKVTLTARGHGGIKAKIFDWAIGVGIKASRVRQERKPVPRLLAAQLAIADRLVLSTIRERLGGRIRFFVSGSAALSRDVSEWFDACGMIILEGYGLTECSAAAAVNLPGDTRIGTVGPALPGSEIKIAPDGEILLRGGGVMRGYHHNPQATAEVLTEDGWLHTGDIGELVDGYLRVTDRKKDLIKTSGGKYVAPQKLEVIFMAVCPYASQIVVHGEGRKFVSALITLDPELIVQWGGEHGLAGRTAAELATEPAVIEMMGGYVDTMNSRLERWETVKKFVVLPRDLSVEEGDLTPSMKVRRKVVERKFMGELDKLYVD
ncbi:MAG TPA: long-chain fatty acid--CoA ligase [Nakamurella sp.]